MKSLTNFWKFIVGQVKSQDSYGRAMTFTYNGENMFTTFIGGCCTIFVIIFSIVYFILLFVQLMTNKFVNTNISNSIQDLETLDAIQLSSTDFAFAFKIDGLTYDQLIDE